MVCYHDLSPALCCVREMLAWGYKGRNVVLMRLFFALLMPCLSEALLIGFGTHAIDISLILPSIELSFYLCTPRSAPR